MVVSDSDQMFGLTQNLYFFKNYKNLRLRKSQGIEILLIEILRTNLIILRFKFYFTLKLKYDTSRLMSQDENLGRSKREEMSQSSYSHLFKLFVSQLFFPVNN